MNTIHKLIGVTVLCAILATTFSGCNTVKGAGRDIQRGGQAIENSADQARR